MAHKIHRTIYRYGKVDVGHFGYLVLRPDGSVGYYHHDNEVSFTFDGRHVQFLNAQGQPTNGLIYHEDANCFMSDDRKGLYLLPLLELRQQPEEWQKASMPLIINTIPKSGTYLIELALRSLGYSSLRLHLSPFLCDDNRDTPDLEIHVAPHQRRISIPAGAVATVMETGEIVVGHIEHHGELNAITNTGAALVHGVRNLRNVLVSLFRFKTKVVAPISAADAVWRAVPGPSGFLAFLAHFADHDIRHTAEVAMAIAERTEPRLRFEDLIEGTLPDQTAVQLEQIRPGFSDAFLAALSQVRDQPTSTLSTERANYNQVWSEAAEAFFQQSGLSRINRLLGYED